MGWFLASIKVGESCRAPFALPAGLDAVIVLHERILRQGLDSPRNEEVELSAKFTFEQNWRPLIWNRNGKRECAFDIEGWLELMTSEAYRPEPRRPLASYLPLHYHAFPKGFRKFASRSYTRFFSRTGRHNFPVSLLNVGTELVLKFASCENPNLSAERSAILSHDIESEEGFRFVPKIAEMEEKSGFRAVWNIVPKFYRVDRCLLHDLKKRGHEIGLHGIWHNHRETFCHPSRLRQEFGALRNFLDEFEIAGYRSPSWYRTDQLFRVISEYFAYDMSSLDCDLLCPGGPGGVGIHRPFRDKYRLLHIPCNIPFEAPCFLGIEPVSLFDYWRPKLEFIANTNGLVVINTHPEREYLASSAMLEGYRRLLSSLREKSFLPLLPKALVSKKILPQGDSPEKIFRSSL